jgi:hypothetical protein
MVAAVLRALLVTMKDTSQASKEQRMYPIDPIHPTLYRERQELLAREAREARLAGQLRAARRERTATSDRRTSDYFPGRVMALWGRTSVPFFRA